MRKKIIKALLFFALTIFIWGMVINSSSNLSDPNPSSDGWSRKTNPEYRFSLEYPADWYASTYNENGFKGNRETKFREYHSFMGPAFVNLQLRSTSNPDLEMVEDWSRSMTRGYKRETSYKEFIGGEIVFRSIYSGSGYYFEHVGISRENDMVIMIFQVEEEQYENYIETFNQIAGSFKSMD